MFLRPLIAHQTFSRALGRGLHAPRLPCQLCPGAFCFCEPIFRGHGRGLAMLVGRRTTMRERVQAGLSRARPQGKTLGRPKAAVRLERVLALRRRVSAYAPTQREAYQGRRQVYDNAVFRSLCENDPMARITPCATAALLTFVTVSFGQVYFQRVRHPFGG